MWSALGRCSFHSSGKGSSVYENFDISILLWLSFTVCVSVPLYWIGKSSRRGTASSLSLAD